jgi:hypothetical protein
MNGLVAQAMGALPDRFRPVVRKVPGRGGFFQLLPGEQPEAFVEQIIEKAS